MMQTVWHYTTESAAQLINNTKKFSPSVFKSTDTAYGQGWYVTDLPPNTLVPDLCDFLWTSQATEAKEKTKAFVKLEIDKRYLQYCRPHVYLLRKEDVNGQDLNIAATYSDSHGNVVIRIVEVVKNFLRKLF